jgi:uncharacterized protein
VTHPHPFEPEPESAFALESTIDFDLEATMRDGTILRADAYRPPTGDGPWPVLLARTPYGKQDPGVLARLNPHAAAHRGYLVIIQDCRGRFQSDGYWQPLVHDRRDGYDTVRWAARLPSASGRVATYGPSYLGYTQRATMAANPRALRAAVPEFTWSNPRDGLISRGGAHELGLITHWTLTLGVNVLERRYAANPTELHRHLADLNAALDDLTTRTYWELPTPELPTLRRLALPTPTLASPPAAATVPTLFVAGWFDAFLQGSLDNYIATRDAGQQAALIVGPWSHDNQSSRIGDTDFGPTADAALIDNGASLLTRELDWLDRHLTDPPPTPPLAPAPDPPVLLFVMGTNQWRHLPTWPPESIDVPWYLHADGRLSPDSPAPDSPPDVFDHDPTDPVPSHGGALLMTPDFPVGPLDQHQTEKRDDVLVYTSEPLTEPLEVIGRIKLHLTAASAATPTADWVARLCDVDPDGVSRNITDGILRSNRPTAESGKYAEHAEHVIDLWSTAHVFLPGHRVRVQITGSCFPRWDRDLTPSRRTVYHDGARPSRLILPCTYYE